MMRTDITEAIVSNTNVTQVKAKESLEVIIEAIQQGLLQDEKIRFTNFVLY